MSAKEHELKVWPEFMPALESGAKAFEIRENDRGFEVGDLLALREWDPKTEEYSGKVLYKQVSYMTSFQQKPGFVVMGIRNEGRAE